MLLPRWRKYALLYALYFSQGLPFGFQAGALAVYLREHGASNTAVGWAAWLAAPWFLKALWAPLVDRWRSGPLGPRRTWIISAQLGLMAMAGVAALFPPDQALTPLLFAIFGMNIAAATQDIATDGWAVDLLDDDELGPGNAAQVVGYKAGMLTSGGILLQFSDRIGWAGFFGVMALLIWAVAIVVLLSPEARSVVPREPKARRAWWEPWRALWLALQRSLATPTGRRLVLLVLTYKFGETLSDAMFKPYLLQVGVTKAEIGQWLGTWGLGFSLAGSFLGGYALPRLGWVRALAVASALRIGPLAAQWWLTAIVPTDNAIIATTCAEHFFGGALTTVMFAWMMSAVDARIGATHFTLLASLEVLGKAVASALSGHIADGAGYGAVFASGATLSILFWWLVLAIAPRARPAIRE